MEIERILARVKYPGRNRVTDWIGQNEQGAWEEELLAVMKVLTAYRKRRIVSEGPRDSDMYHVMKLMGYSRSKWLSIQEQAARESPEDELDRQRKLRLRAERERARTNIALERSEGSR